MGMFDHQVTKTKLVIVHSENTAAFANFLQMLITTQKEQDSMNIGSADKAIETTVWSDKDYAAQKPTLSNQDHILFIGRSKMLSEEAYGMTKKFDNFGMQYGWLGKYAYMKVSGERFTKKLLDSYIEFAKKYDPEVTVESIFGLEAQNEWRKRNTTQAILEKGAIIGLLGDIGSHMLLERKKNMSLFRSNQYRVLTLAFYKEGLASFLEGK